MPSFRECENEEAKTLSMIYDDDNDLARDTENQPSYSATQMRYITETRINEGEFSPVRKPTQLSDSVQVTAEAPKRIATHMITAESINYETRQPPRPSRHLVNVSNQEIEDELKLYSTVQSYDHQSSICKQMTPKAPGQGGNEWLRRTLKNRLSASGQGPLRRSGSWKPTSGLNKSLASAHSGRSSSYT